MVRLNLLSFDWIRETVVRASSQLSAWERRLTQQQLAIFYTTIGDTCSCFAEGRLHFSTGNSPIHMPAGLDQIKIDLVIKWKAVRFCQ